MLTSHTNIRDTNSHHKHTQTPTHNIAQQQHNQQDPSNQSHANPISHSQQTYPHPPPFTHPTRPTAGFFFFCLIESQNIRKKENS